MPGRTAQVCGRSPRGMVVGVLDEDIVSGVGRLTVPGRSETVTGGWEPNIHGPDIHSYRFLILPQRRRPSVMIRFRESEAGPTQGLCDLFPRLLELGQTGPGRGVDPLTAPSGFRETGERPLAAPGTRRRPRRCRRRGSAYVGRFETATGVGNRGGGPRRRVQVWDRRRWLWVPPPPPPLPRVGSGPP